jgi:hypothetical protein
LNWRSLHEGYPNWAADNYSDSKQKKCGFDPHATNDDPQCGLPSTHIADYQKRFRFATPASRKNLSVTFSIFLAVSIETAIAAGTGCLELQPVKLGALS